MKFSVNKNNFEFKIKIIKYLALMCRIHQSSMVCFQKGFDESNNWQLKATKNLVMINKNNCKH